MDLGSSIVDLLSIAQLANKLRKEITAAPAQYKAISEELVHCVPFTEAAHR